MRACHGGLHRSRWLTIAGLAAVNVKDRGETIVLDLLLVNLPNFLELDLARRAPGTDLLALDQPPIAFPPLGLAYLGAAVQDDGFDVAVLNAWGMPQPAKAVVDRVRRDRPAVVGLSVLLFNLPSAYLLVPRIREASPDSVIVLGNLQVAEDPTVVQKVGADFGILGWGEAPLVALTRHVVRGQGSLDNLPGLVTPHGDTVRVVPPAEQDIDAIPWPDRSLLGEGAYRSPSDPRPMTMVVTQRGCPHRCSYCHHSSQNIRSVFPWRCRDMDDVVAEVAWLTEHTDTEYLEFTDDALTSSRRRVLEFCRGLRQRGVQVEWGCDARADRLDPELLRAMHGAGCRKLSLGVETGSETIRRAMAKNVSDHAVRSAIRSCRDVGIQTTANFMFGLPGESIDDLERTTRFAMDLGPDFVEFHVAMVLPNTELFRRALQRGLVTEDVFDRFMRGETPFPAFVPEGLTLSDLRRVDARAYRRFYLRLGYVVQRVRSLRGPADLLYHIKMALWVLRSTGSKS